MSERVKIAILEAALPIVAAAGVICYELEKKKNEDLRSTNSNLEDRLNKNSGYLQSVTSSEEEARRVLDHTKEQLRQETQRGRDLSEDLRGAQNRLQQIENERDDLRRQQEALRQNVTHLENERNDLRCQQEALRQNVTHLENEGNDLRCQQGALREDVTHLQNELASSGQYGNECLGDLASWMAVSLGVNAQLQEDTGFGKLSEVADLIAQLYDNDIPFALYQARVVMASEERARALGNMKLPVAADGINIDPINKGDFRLLLNSRLLNQKGFVLGDKFFELADSTWRDTPVNIRDDNGAGDKWCDTFTNSDLYKKIEATLNGGKNDHNISFAEFLVDRWGAIKNSDRQLLKNVVSYAEVHPSVRPFVQTMAGLHDNKCSNQATEMIRNMALAVDRDVSPDGNNIDELSKQILTVYRKSIFGGALEALPDTDNEVWGAEFRRAYKYVLSGAFGLKTDESDREYTGRLHNMTYGHIVDGFSGGKGVSISIDGICRVACDVFLARDGQTKTQLIEDMSGAQISYKDFCKIASDCEDRADQAADLAEQKLKSQAFRNHTAVTKKAISEAREQAIAIEKSRNFQVRFGEFIDRCDGFIDSCARESRELKQKSMRELKQELIRWRDDDKYKLSLARLKECVDGLNSGDANNNIPELTYLDPATTSGSRYISHTLYPIYLVNNHVIDIS